MDFNNVTGLKIKQLREHLQLSQTQLADLVGYKDKTAIAKVEAGKVDLPQSKIMAFSKALHTNPSYLLESDLYGDIIDDNDPDYIYYYQFDKILNDYVHELGGFLYYNPQHKKLFDDAMKIEQKDIELAKAILDKISNNSNNE